MVALQVGDEQQSDIEDPTGYTKAWFDAAHAGNLYTNQLLYVNSFFINNGTNYANFIANANPDAISWDSYPFANPHGAYILPKNWLALGNIFRRYALGSYIGATGATPRPYVRLGLAFRPARARGSPGHGGWATIASSRSMRECMRARRGVV